ncbi:MAG: hypothetical protein AWM53_00916 [Candidatus Dichloromethanomonas elyunquensis]|nr:MAG: hypothetical protein AWM53_00916 [Candidatus Dichloromethanomonas elyunquensis]
MFYRMNQFFKALLPQINNQEYHWLNSILTPAERILFYRQTLTEQKHALDVAKDIEKQKKFIYGKFGEVQYSNLLHASLLHDCGKSLFKFRLWQRVIIVLIGNLPLKWQNNLIKQRHIIRKTMLINRQHPAWGGHLAAKAGVNEDILTLIRNHHKPANSMERILHKADNRH